MQQPSSIPPLSNEDRAKLSCHFLGKSGHFGPYFDRYDFVAQAHYHFGGRVGLEPAFDLLGPDTVIQVSTTLRGNIHKTKGEIIKILLKHQNLFCSHETAEDAIRLAVQAMLMVDAAGSSWPLDQSNNWAQDTTFAEFVGQCFPVRDDASSKEIKAAFYRQESMKAWKLRSRQRVRFQRTDDLTEHLLYDEKQNCLYLFHHAEVLKTLLRAYRTEPDPLSIDLNQSLERGCLPPQLLVETLHSLQDVLFHPADSRSKDILQSLVEESGFDRECRNCVGFGIFANVPGDFEYKYWGERIADLHRLATSRRPRNSLERWVDRQNTDGNALFVALMALLISIIVGIISILLSAVQLWVGYMAWKHPVK